MQKFFSKFLKQKKILAFVFLGIIICSSLLYVPYIVKAQGMVGTPGSTTTPTDQFGSGTPTPVPLTPQSPGDTPTTLTIPTTNKKPAEECQNSWTWYKAFGAALADVVFLWGPQEIAYLITNLSSWTMSTIRNLPITTGSNGAASAFANGWASTRDLANMLIVLGFVIVGISTALRIREYEAKKALLPLIIVAILINFSGLICGLIIDASNITMNGLIAQNGGATGSMGVTLYDSVTKSQGTLACAAIGADNLSRYAMIEAMFGFIYLALALSFLYLAIVILARYAILGILFVLSPLAFAFWAFPFPKAKDLWQKWWNSFLKWAFVGVGISFFLNIAGQTLAGLNTSSGISTPNIIEYLFVVLAIMVVGIMISVKSSGMVGAAVMGLATGAAGFAMGAAGGVAKGGAKMLNKATGGRAGTLAQKVSNSYGQALEGLGLRGAGVGATKRGEAMKEPQSRMSALVAEGNIDHVQRTAKGEGMGHNSAERAGAIAALLKSNNFDPNDAKQVAGLTHFQNQGGNLSEYSTKDPRLARYDISATRQTMAKNPGMSETDAQQKNVDTNYSKLGVKGMRDLPADAMDINFLRKVNPDKNLKASDEYSTEHLAKQKRFITAGTTELAHANALITRLKSTGRPEDLSEARNIEDNQIAISKM